MSFQACILLFILWNINGVVFTELLYIVTVYTDVLNSRKRRKNIKLDHMTCDFKSFETKQ